MNPRDILFGSAGATLPRSWCRVCVEHARPGHVRSISGSGRRPCPGVGGADPQLGLPEGLRASLPLVPDPPKNPKWGQYKGRRRWFPSGSAAAGTTPGTRFQQGCRLQWNLMGIKWKTFRMDWRSNTFLLPSAALFSHFLIY